MNLFGGSEARKDAAKLQTRTARISTGWAALVKELRAEEGLRVLDVGPTSSTNINFLTGLGHSVYMADLIGDLADPKWAHAEEEGFPVAAYLAANFQFSGRDFDAVLLWDTCDYLPADLRQAVIERLFEVTKPGGKVLALFHVKPEREWNRYHLREDGKVDTQFAGTADTRPSLNNRQIEQLFQRFASYRFFLAKDNLREVLVTR